MKTALIISGQDPAGMNIKDFLDIGLLKKVSAELHLIEEDSVFAENIVFVNYTTAKTPPILPPP